MAYTLQNVLNDIAAYVDQDTTLATGTELTVRVNLVNQALSEWGNTYQWKSLRYTFSPTVLLSMTSVALPSNYKKLMSPVFDKSLSASNEYDEINPTDRFGRSTTEKYSYTGGDPARGWFINLSPALTSGVSLVLDYQAFPSSMATLQDICVCPHPEFLVKRVISNILSSRADSRFPTLKSEADDALSNMIEEEGSLSGGMENTTQDNFRRAGFRIGND